MIENNQEVSSTQNNTTVDNSEINNPIISDNNINNQQNNIENTEPKTRTEKGKDPNVLLESLKGVSNEDRESIKELAKQHKNVLSQFTINKIHKKVPTVSTKDIRNYIRVLIAQGEITLE